MKIRLTNEWMGHEKGAVLDLIPVAAQKLIIRKVAEVYYGDRTGESFVVQEQSLPQPNVEKQIGEAPVDKMVHRAENKNLFKRRKAVSS